MPKFICKVHRGLDWKEIHSKVLTLHGGASKLRVKKKAYSRLSHDCKNRMGITKKRKGIMRLMKLKRGIKIDIFVESVQMRK